MGPKTFTAMISLAAALACLAATPASAGAARGSLGVSVVVMCRVSTHAVPAAAGIPVSMTCPEGASASMSPAGSHLAGSATSGPGHRGDQDRASTSFVTVTY